MDNCQRITNRYRRIDGITTAFKDVIAGVGAIVLCRHNHHVRSNIRRRRHGGTDVAHRYKSNERWQSSHRFLACLNREKGAAEWSSFVIEDAGFASVASIQN